jgi:predicted PurR-regulated permease PerM
MDTRISTLFYATGFAIMVVWLLYIGQAILLPIVLGILTVYILATASTAVARWPLMGRFPAFVHRLLVLLIFVVIVVLIALMISNNIEYIISQLPLYQANLQTIADDLAVRFGLDTMPSLEKVVGTWREELDIQSVALRAVGSISSVGSVLFMAMLYAGFLFSEVGSFRKKTRKALRTDADQALGVVAEVNHRIGVYLTVKTFINIILAAVSFAIMWLMDIDSALFWAILIGLLNYIPYVGSAIGVAFPVMLTLAQFGSLSWAILAFILLMAVQTFVGNVLEPKMIGKSVNLSSFVVLVALVFWTALWGLPGAILSVPLTSVLMIILAASKGTRPLAIMLSADGDV